ncbi:hypothetical protein G7085_00620 [Tessaracoccus sp. HDW20]|uniref:hypothetical protein n=1 Tax=Tessaracoccus coleopterorum TaxID=2714950 RepID=UPI0018D31986|nr:hypothetical protein [Tessaracoccus coleopterorum]NHB83705.1 hypothetical protein [Tessaracoccus coleopterorum]
MPHHPAGSAPGKPADPSGARTPDSRANRRAAARRSPGEADSSSMVRRSSPTKAAVESSFWGLPWTRSTGTPSSPRKREARPPSPSTPWTALTDSTERAREQAT